MPTLQDIINQANELEPNSYSNETLTDWVNELELQLKNDTTKENYFEVTREADTVEYDLPTNVTFDQVRAVTFKGHAIPKVGVMHDDELEGYSIGSDNTKIKLYPKINNDDTEVSFRIAYTPNYEHLVYQDDKETELTAGERYKQMYVLYLIARIQFFNKDYQVYNNTNQQYNDIFEEYRRERIRNAPINKERNLAKNYW